MPTAHPEATIFETIPGNCAGRKFEILRIRMSHMEYMLSMNISTNVNLNMNNHSNSHANIDTNTSINIEIQIKKDKICIMSFVWSIVLLIFLL